MLIVIVILNFVFITLQVALPPCTNRLATRADSREIISPQFAFINGWRDGRVAEGAGLLNRYTVKSRIGGSNPPLSASFHQMILTVTHN